jgi:hypothetical protein
MNEFIAAEPTSCENSSELRLLLRFFGPYAGRYLAEYPGNWGDMLRNCYFNSGDVEAERIKTCLKRAREQGALLRNPSLAWDEAQAWVDNANALASSTPPKIHGIVVARKHIRQNELTLDDIDTRLPLTADEKVPGTVDEYLRVSRTLLAISPELFFVDPYLNPCKRDIAPVMKGMLKKISDGRKCQRVACFARTSRVVGERSHSWDEVKTAWTRLLAEVGWPKDRIFEYLLLDDDGAAENVHPRYLFSIKGGIRFDHGFQIQSSGKRVDVCPINATIHNAVLLQFKEGKHDWKVDFRYCSTS